MTDARESPLRDTSKLATKEKYDKDIAFFDAQIAKRREALEKGIANASYAGQYAFQGAVHSLERLWCMYSRGDSVADLAAYFPTVVDLHAWALDFESKGYPPDVMESRKLWKLNFEMYVHALWLLSFALCLRAEDPVLARLLQVLGNAGEDALFDRMAASRVKDRPIGASLVYPRVTQTLYDAALAPESARGRMLVKYVGQWYGKMRRARFHDAHLRHGGDTYYGYWCFEVAGAVAAFGLDDRPLLDLPTYPKDLVRG